MLALALGMFFWANAIPVFALEPIRTTEELVAAVKSANEGDTVELAAGEFELDATLELKGRMTLKGAGMDKTTLTHAAKWKPSSKTQPDPEMRLEGLDADAYLIRIKRDTSGVAISDMTLRGPQLHRAVFAWFYTDLHLHHLRVKDTLWSGVRTFGMKKAKIHDCEFVDAGGRWNNGTPGKKGGITGGGIFATWMGDCDIYNNRFTRANEAPEREFYGLKVRQGVRCHIHHNYFQDSYSIEFVRNGVEIDHNLFDFDPTAELSNGFAPNSVYSESLAEMAGPGAIPDILDFRGVVCFGMSGDGAPFCFDSRERGTEPRVIWWDDVYWRVVAPDFASFLSLLDLQDDSS